MPDQNRANSAVGLITQDKINQQLSSSFPPATLTSAPVVEQTGGLIQTTSTSGCMSRYGRLASGIRFPVVLLLNFLVFAVTNVMFKARWNNLIELRKQADGDIMIRSFWKADQQSSSRSDFSNAQVQVITQCVTFCSFAVETVTVRTCESIFKVLLVKFAFWIIVKREIMTKT